jgi:glycosyltransferase involved in cell wall biosynthesis
MKIVIIHNLLWSHYRNVIYCELQKQTTNSDFDIKVLQIARNERSRASMEGVNKMSFDYEYDLLFDEFIEDIGAWELTKKLIQKINTLRPDVVNLVGYYTFPQALTLIYCWFRGIKIILSNDSTPADNAKIWWKEFIKRFLISLCDGFFNFGTLATQHMKVLGGKDEQMLANKCAAVDNDFIEKAHQEFIKERVHLQKTFAVSPKNFIFVGRFIELKNLFLLLDAFKNTQKTGKTTNNWGLILLGEGILKEKLQDFIAENNISNVHFISGKAWYEIPKFLAIADVFVLPSSSEPWGLVVNEAMICKMPVIVSDKCGCAVDLVQENKNGFIFPYNDLEKLTIYLQKFINNEVNIAEMGKKSSEIIKDYTPQKVAKSMLEGFRIVGK